MKYNIYDKENIENAIKFYYKNKVSHKEVYEKFNIKRATYFTYLKICKEIDFIQIGGNKKYEDSEKINSVFKKQKDIIEQEKKKNNDNVQTKKNKVVDLEEMYGTSKLLNKLGEERKKAKI